MAYRKVKTVKIPSGEKIIISSPRSISLIYPYIYKQLKDVYCTDDFYLFPKEERTRKFNLLCAILFRAVPKKNVSYRVLAKLHGDNYGPKAITLVGRNFILVCYLPNRDDNDKRMPVIHGLHAEHRYKYYLNNGIKHPIKTVVVTLQKDDPTDVLFTQQLPPRYRLYVINHAQIRETLAVIHRSKGAYDTVF